MWINRDKKTKTVEKRTDMENKKLTKLEKYWIMYDVGNSAFVMLTSVQSHSREYRPVGVQTDSPML